MFGWTPHCSADRCAVRLDAALYGWAVRFSAEWRGAQLDAALLEMSIAVGGSGGCLGRAAQACDPAARLRRAIRMRGPRMRLGGVIQAYARWPVTATKRQSAASTRLVGVMRARSEGLRVIALTMNPTKQQAATA